MTTRKASTLAAALIVLSAVISGPAAPPAGRPVQAADHPPATWNTSMDNHIGRGAQHLPSGPTS